MTETLSLDRRIAIAGEEIHPHAGSQIRALLGDRVLPAGTTDGADLTIQMLTVESLPEGAFSIDVPSNGTRISISGGPFSGVIYGANEFVRRQNPIEHAIPVGTIAATPGLPYRTFWNWD